MMDWVHCNVCFTVPSKTRNEKFFLTHCGHLACDKCLNAARNDLCLYCKKSTRYIEINRNINSDIRLLFSNPKDVANEYAQKMKTIINFQYEHRLRLSRHREEKLQKSSKWIKHAQTEMSKSNEAQQILITERDQAKHDISIEKRRVRELEDKLAERDQEIKRLRIVRHSPFTGSCSRNTLQNNSRERDTHTLESAHYTPLTYDGHSKNNNFPSLNGPTPLGIFSDFQQDILPCATSTPKDIFKIPNLGQAINTNAIRTNEIYRGSGNYGVKSLLSTPALLGIGSKTQSMMHGTFFS